MTVKHQLPTIRFTVSTLIPKISERSLEDHVKNTKHLVISVNVHKYKANKKSMQGLSTISHPCAVNAVWGLCNLSTSCWRFSWRFLPASIFLFNSDNTFASFALTASITLDWSSLSSSTPVLLWTGLNKVDLHVHLVITLIRSKRRSHITSNNIQYSVKNRL